MQAVVEKRKCYQKSCPAMQIAAVPEMTIYMCVATHM